MSEQATKRDPVCGMPAPADEYGLAYRQLHFAFCSPQCRERFLQNPRPCIVVGSRKAPAQEGRRMIKRRRLKLEQPLSPEMARQVLDAVQAMMGIERVTIEGDCITIRYDLLQATETQIEAELARGLRRAGARVVRAVAARVRALPGGPGAGKPLGGASVGRP